MKTLFYILALFISVNMVAQPKLGMHTNYTITPAAATNSVVGVPYGSTVSVTCFIQNKGNAVFNGFISLLKSVHSSSMQTSAVAVNSVIAVLNPNDTMRVVFTDSVTSGSYKITGNGNTIVVWPVSSSAITVDSLFTGSVYVHNPTRIQELDAHLLFIYPNPANNELFIQSKTGVEYREIMIRDLQMKTLYRQPFAESIDIGHLPAGTYIITVSDSKGTGYSSRFTKTD